MDAVVGRIGRAHGIRGEVGVEVRTDAPAVRFAAGAVLRLPDGGRPALTVLSTRRHGDRLLVRFADIVDRTQAEALRGQELVADVGTDEPPTDPDEFYDAQLVGLTMRTTSGDVVGTITEVQHRPAQDLLVVRSADRVHLVPFVTALVPDVDLAGGTVTVEPVPGLLGDERDDGS